jgi:D-methionine transport system ATP-binding protein
MQLKLEHLNKTYTTKRASVTAVKDISLDFPDNAIIGIIGKSGAVKSSACQYVAVIDKGCVVETGAVSDVFRSPKHEITREFLSNIRRSEISVESAIAYLQDNGYEVSKR